jgi:transposase
VGAGGRPPGGARPSPLATWLYLTAFVAPTSGETVWYLSNGIDKRLFEWMLAAFARKTGAGRDRIIVLLLDQAGWHSEPGLAVPEGLRLVYLPSYTPELQPAEHLWPLVDEPVANRYFESLDELDYLPEEWGYDGPAIRRAIEEYNASTVDGRTLEPGRAKDSAPLDEGPWYVIECVPAITFPFHGVRIDDRARVLSTDGSPVPGLLCAGSDTGGLYHRAYAGGLASALVFGLTAARTATED